MVNAWMAGGRLGNYFRGYFVKQAGNQNMEESMKRFWFSLLIFVFVLSGCAPAAARNQSYSSEMPMDSGIAPAPQMSAPAMAESSEMVVSSGKGYESSVDQLIIQNASLTIVVEEPASAMESVIKMTDEMKGFVVDSNIYKTRTENGIDLPEAHLTIRVPAERLTEAMEKIKDLVPDPSTDILNENRSGQNVTKEYTDLKSRLKNLEEAEAQLREIMASATRTEDVMSVFNQLTQVREQIEVIKGQMKYYEESAAMSAIDITIRSKASIAPLTIGGWQPAGVARDAIQSLINALKFFANAGIWFVLFLLPVLILLCIPVVIVFLIIRAFVRRKNARKVINSETTDEKNN
jgi:hypothetical protein